MRQTMLLGAHLCAEMRGRGLRCLYPLDGMPTLFLVTSAHSLPFSSDCSAKFLVQKLTSSKEEMKESLPRGTDAMPPAELVSWTPEKKSRRNGQLLLLTLPPTNAIQCSTQHFAAGVAFTFNKKAGLGLTVETGEPPICAQLPAAGSLASRVFCWTKMNFKMHAQATALSSARSSSHQALGWMRVRRTTRLGPGARPCS